MSLPVDSCTPGRPSCRAVSASVRAWIRSWREARWAAEEAAYYASMGQPCEGCLYATGRMQDCDGTCQTLPYPEWDYFKAHPDETPPGLLPTMTAIEADS